MITRLYSSTAQDSHSCSDDNIAMNEILLVMSARRPNMNANFKSLQIERPAVVRAIAPRSGVLIVK